MSERNSTIQTALAYFECQCEIDKQVETSVGLNLLQIDFKVKTDCQPELRVKQGDLVSKFMDGEPPVTLLSVDFFSLKLPKLDSNKLKP